MSIATPDGGRAIRQDKTPSPLPRITAVSIVFAGVYAVIRLRMRRMDDPLAKTSEVPRSLREDVGLPAREPDRPGWWEWR